MLVIDLFCDASINTYRKIACAGCKTTIVNDGEEIESLPCIGLLQFHATNNSGEILAIYLGVLQALKLRELYPTAVFRLFSDSKISIYGIRSWILSWVNHSTRDGVLIASNGEPVINQETFIEIVNLIKDNQLYIEFYHQRGHVSSTKDLNNALSHFVKVNKVAPKAMETDIKYLSDMNNVVDEFSRTSLAYYISYGKLPENVTKYHKSPLIFCLQRKDIHAYIPYIDKKSVVSRHNFNGGYSQ